MILLMKEFQFKGFVMNGFVMLFLHLIVLTAAIVACFLGATLGLAVLGLFLALVWFVLCAGYVKLEPNEARVMVFFGKYRGTFTETGYFWVNPLLTKKKLSLRARNLDVEPIKVNDKVGNPIMVGLVLVWKLKDTYKAMFEIDSQTMAGSVAAVGSNATAAAIAASRMASVMNALEHFVKIQSDAALRQVAAGYNYDNNEGGQEEITLRSGGEEVNDILEKTLNERLDMAGIEVVEARINYLAYAPEIAAVMLRRQQAAAVISAREKIVEGAVSMVKMALDKLKDDNVVELDENSELMKRVEGLKGRARTKAIENYIVEVLGGRSMTLHDGISAVVDNADLIKMAQDAFPHGRGLRRTTELGEIAKIIDNARYSHSDYNARHNKFSAFRVSFWQKILQLFHE